jgi:hypothetical protein
MKIVPTSDGEEIVFEPSKKEKNHQFKLSLFWMALGTGLLIWWGPAVKTYFTTGEVVAPAVIRNFDLEQQTLVWMIRIIPVWIVWLILGSIYEGVLIVRRRDRFLLAFDHWITEKKRFITRTMLYKASDPVTLSISSSGTLKAIAAGKSRTLTVMGTEEERRQVLEKIQKRYASSEKTPLYSASSETVAAYTVKYHADGSILIYDSNLSRYGCASIFWAAALTGMIYGAVKGGFMIFFLLPFFLLLSFGLLQVFYNLRRVETSKGSLRVRERLLGGPGMGWMIHRDNVYTFGALFIPKEYPNELLIKDPNDPNGFETIVLKFTQQVPNDSVLYLARLISKSTGFPLVESNKKIFQM